MIWHQPALSTVFIINTVSALKCLSTKSPYSLTWHKVDKNIYDSENPDQYPFLYEEKECNSDEWCAFYRQELGVNPNTGVDEVKFLYKCETASENRDAQYSANYCTPDNYVSVCFETDLCNKNVLAEKIKTWRPERVDFNTISHQSLTENSVRLSWKMPSNCKKYSFDVEYWSVSDPSNIVKLRILFCPRRMSQKARAKTQGPNITSPKSHFFKIKTDPYPTFPTQIESKSATYPQISDTKCILKPNTLLPPAKSTPNLTEPNTLFTPETTTSATTSTTPIYSTPTENVTKDPTDTMTTSFLLAKRVKFVKLKFL